jgi:hypothetical protein
VLGARYDLSQIKLERQQDSGALLNGLTDMTDTINDMTDMTDMTDVMTNMTDMTA